MFIQLFTDEIPCLAFVLKFSKGKKNVVKIGIDKTKIAGCW